MTILTDSDKETIRRTVPKASNKIHVGAVVRLYIAYPNKQKWTYTGLQGAAVLANDLIGNTFWVKLVDISPSNRGVVWDQEIYDSFSYNTDRTFFHTFELENCLAGLSFADEKEAKTFKKKMDEREKHADKRTKSTPFQASGSAPASTGSPREKNHSRLGGFLHGYRSSSASHIPSPQTQFSTPSSGPSSLELPPKKSGTSALDEVDPSWRGMLSELLKMGITEDQIEENADFIKSYIESKQASGAGGGVFEEVSNGGIHEGRARAPPPPPPPPPTAPPPRAKSISPQNTGSVISSKRGPPPALPSTRRSRIETGSALSPTTQPSPSAKSPERTPSPPRSSLKFRAPPPIADAGKFAHTNAPAPPARQRAASHQANLAPPPPPRPPKTPTEDDIDIKPKFAVPPPFKPVPNQSVAAPHRAAVPPPPPRASRDPYSTPSISSAPSPPPLPPKTPNAPTPHSAPPLAPPLPAARNVPPGPAPPPLPTLPRPTATPSPGLSLPPPPPPLPSLPRPTASLSPGISLPPPPPPLPPSNNAPPPPPPRTDHGPPAPPPPPPPMPSSGGLPPPPLPPGRNAATNPSKGGAAAPGKDDLLASIRASGGLGSGRLRRVSSQEKRDRSAALVPGSAAASDSKTGASHPASTGGGGGGGVADALAQALSARNKKVSVSDDEDDEDDWDDDAPKRR